MTVPPLTSVVNDKQKNLIINEILTWCSLNWKAILAELVSTMLLLLFGCMSCIPIDGFSQQPALYAPLGFGLTVMFNVQIFGHISGAHMNPSVTLAAIIWGKTKLSVGVAFVIVQCIGAILGYGILIAVSPVNLVSQGICLTQPHSEHNPFQALAIEVALTAILSFLCCALWDPVNEFKQDSTSIKFGFAVAGLSIAGGPLTGASMNPARSLGPSLWTSNWNAHWVYWVGPLIGASVAAIIYKYIWLNERGTSEDN